MPSGVYPRSEAQKQTMRNNLAKGHSPEARRKAIASLRKNASSDEWRQMVSAKTKEAMKRPEVRKKHLRRLRKFVEANGVNFRGGNGQTPTRTIRILTKLLKPHGFIPEYLVNTKKCRHKHPGAANCYKIDFANPLFMLAIEIDGPCHSGLTRKARDQKKTDVLESLGWTVIRIRHD